MTMSDRIAVMHGGVIEQIGTPVEVYEHPKTRFVAGFIGETNIFDGEVSAVDGNVITIETRLGQIKSEAEGVNKGDKIAVSIRPEQLKLSSSPVEGFGLHGKVKDFIYVGSVIKTNIDAEDFEIKHARVASESSYKEGEEVYIYWDPKKSVVITDTKEK